MDGFSVWKQVLGVIYTTSIMAPHEYSQAKSLTRPELHTPCLQSAFSVRRGPKSDIDL